MTGQRGHEDDCAARNVSEYRTGVIGALPGGWTLVSLFGPGTINQNDSSPSLLLISFPGAVILLMTVNLLRRRQVR